VFRFGGCLPPVFQSFHQSSVDLLYSAHHLGFRVTTIFIAIAKQFLNQGNELAICSIRFEGKPSAAPAAFASFSLLCLLDQNSYCHWQRDYKAIAAVQRRRDNQDKPKLWGVLIQEMFMQTTVQKRRDVSAQCSLQPLMSRQISFALVQRQ